MATKKRKVHKSTKSVTGTHPKVVGTTKRKQHRDPWKDILF